jgi:hypothetical protein
VSAFFRFLVANGYKIVEVQTVKISRILIVFALTPLLGCKEGTTSGPGVTDAKIDFRIAVTGKDSVVVSKDELR